MTAEQFELMKQAARNLLAHHHAGRKCDPEALRWAEQLLKANPRPLTVPHEANEGNKS
jgi:hypothetical protein